MTCIEALKQFVGFVNTTIVWKRIEWSDKIADQYRYGEQTSDTADLSLRAAAVAAKAASNSQGGDSCFGLSLLQRM